MSDNAIIMVGSDVCPVPSDEVLFTGGDSRALLRDYHDLWTAADYSILNLECPLTLSAGPIPKIGPHLKALPECVAFLVASRTNAVCLANNHLRDFGDVGVLDTLRVCRSSGLKTVGAGSSLDEARLPLRTEVNGIRMGVMAMAEREFSIAETDQPGANPIDYQNFTILKELKSQVDFVLVLVHGGTEMLDIPRPGLVDLCRFLVDQGAGAVVVQHTHCVGCVEVYRDAPIVYGQGNFLFGSHSTPVEKMDERWFLGMLVELQIARSGPCQIKLDPYEQSRGFHGLKALDADRRQAFLREVDQRSRLLSQPAELHKQWKAHCVREYGYAIGNSFGLTGLLARANHRLEFASMLQTKNGARCKLHMLTCESHRELLGACLGINL